MHKYLNLIFQTIIMYINKIDNLLDNLINKFNLYLIKKNIFKLILKTINFVSLQNNFLMLIKEFVENEKIDTQIENILKNKKNSKYIFEIIKRYFAYYIYLSISYFYTESRDLYITNIIESSKDQKNSNFKIENFFNSDNNSKLINFFNDIKNLLSIIKLSKSIDRIKEQLNNNPIKFDSTIKLIKILGEEHIINYFLIDDNRHNILKTLIFKIIYFNEERNEIVNIIYNDDETDFKYIDIVQSKETKLVDFFILQKFLSIKQIKSGLSEEIYSYLEENKLEKELNIKENIDFINFLFENKIFVPITEDFLRYHDDNEKYDTSSLLNQNEIKERDATKIKYIIDKINKIRNLHSIMYKNNQKLKINALNEFNKKEREKDAITFNDNEDKKIIQKLQESEKTLDLDLLSDLENIRKYAYVNYKDFSKDGFKIRPKKLVKCIRYSNLIHKNEKKNLDLRMGNDSLDINVIGIALNYNKISLECLKLNNLVNVKDITKSENGFESFQKILGNKGLRDKNLLYYWLFDLTKDKPKLNSYINISKLNLENSIFNLLNEVYKNYIEIRKNEIYNFINKNIKEFNNFKYINILNQINKSYFDLNFDLSIKREIINYIYTNKLKEKDITIDETDNIIPGKSGNIIKLPIVKVEKEKENIIVISKEEKEINLEEEYFKPICHHYIKWNNINKKQKNNLKNEDLNQEIFNFVKKYVKQNDNDDYICKSCGEVLNLKKFVKEGTYIKEKDTFLTTSLAVNFELKKIPKYANYNRTIKNIEKNIEKLAFSTNLNNYLGNSPIIMLRRRMIMKDSIDLILIHTTYIKNNLSSKNNKKEFNLKYGINDNLTNLFFFELKDDIFLTSSQDTDYYKIIKYNNVLIYIFYILISDLNPGQILSLKDDKRCNYYLFNKIKDSLFKNLFIRINEKDKIPIIKIPLLCYVIFYISCVFVSQKFWLWNAKEKETFNPIIQSTIIHTLVDLINSIAEANYTLKDENKNYLYEILVSRFNLKLKNLYNDKELLKRIQINSDEKIKIDAVSKKVTYSTKKIQFINIPNNDIKLIHKNYKQENNPTRQLKIKPFKKESDLLNFKTNCEDGNFHQFVLKDKKLSCSLCKKEFIKMSDSGSKEILNIFLQKNLKDLLKDYCISGNLHELDSSNKCQLCKINPLTYKYSDKDIEKFKNNYYTNISNIQNNLIEKTKKNNEKYIEKDIKIKQKLKKLDKQYLELTKNKLVNYVDDFIDKIINILSKKVKFENRIIFIKDTFYFIDHNYLGIEMRNGFKVFKYENKIINEYNEFFEKDVLYYKDVKNTIVYYDAVTNQYLGYKLNNKIIKQKSTAYLKIEYSIRDKILMLGLSNSYMDIKCFNKNCKNNLVESLIRYRNFNLKQIVSRIVSFIFRINNNKKDVNFFSLEEKIIVNTFIKSLKNFKIKNKENKKRIFKEFELVINNIEVEKISDDKNLKLNNNFININVLDSLNNSDSKLIFYILYNFNKLLDYNNDVNIKSILATLIIRIIEFNYDQYYVPIENYNIRKFTQILSLSNANIIENLHNVSSYEELLKSQEIDDENVKEDTDGVTKEEQKELEYDNQEEQDAVDIDDYEEEDFSYMNYDDE